MGGTKMGLEKDYAIAVRNDDFLEAGHIKELEADDLGELGRIEDAKGGYATAIGFYKIYEMKTGRSVPQIKRIAEKLFSLP